MSIRSLNRSAHQTGSQAQSLRVASGYAQRRSFASQKGVALVVSLVLLIALTIIGVATLNGTRLNEKITSNAQQKAIAFEVAESAIASVMDQAYLKELVGSDPENTGNNPAPVTSDPADTGIDSDYDQTDGSRNLNADGTVTVQYCGIKAPVGSGLNSDESSARFVSVLLDINGVATIANSSTRADHMQRVTVVAAVKGNRTGNCTTR